jgi:hypothetical protein
MVLVSGHAFTNPQAFNAGNPGSAGPMHGKGQIVVLAPGAMQIPVSHPGNRSYFSFCQVF